MLAKGLVLLYTTDKRFRSWHGASGKVLTSRYIVLVTWNGRKLMANTRTTMAIILTALHFFSLAASPLASSGWHRTRAILQYNATMTMKGNRKPRQVRAMPYG